MPRFAINLVVAVISGAALVCQSALAALPASMDDQLNAMYPDVESLYRCEYAKQRLYTCYFALYALTCAKK
jgi:hypothetical protein